MTDDGGSEPEPAIRRADADENDATDGAGTSDETNSPPDEVAMDDPASTDETNSPPGDVAIDDDETAAEERSSPEDVASDTVAASDAEPAGQDTDGIPPDVREYDKFSKIEGSTYERANEFLRERTYITAREWAIARLCADFRTETGVEMTKIGEHLPQLVPFMTDTYSPQAVNQARASFEQKVQKAGATFLYGALSDFFTAEELDDVMYESTEVAKFLLEVEGVELAVEEELEAEERVSDVMREVREHSVALRHDRITCPECGHQIQVEDED